MLSSLRNVFRIPDLRNKVVFTLMILMLYRLGSHIPVPGIDISALKTLEQQAGLYGDQLWSRDPDDPEVTSVRLGAFDGDPGIRPSSRQFVAYAAPWEPIPDDGLPQYPEHRPK